MTTEPSYLQTCALSVSDSKKRLLAANALFLLCFFVVFTSKKFKEAAILSLQFAPIY